MSMNTLGKALVLLQLALSVLLLTWAVATFLSPIDWGKREAAKAWHDPPDGKKEFANERLAARIDERIAGYKKYVESKQLALNRVQLALARLAATEAKFGENHLVYAAELERIERGSGAQKFREVKYDPGTGQLALKPPRPWGLPVLETAVPGEKSYAAYLGDLAKKMASIQAVALKIEDLVEKKKVLTIRLNGKQDEKGNLLLPGLYHLIEGESEAQQKLKEELTYLQPLWVRELYNAQLLRARRLGLEARLRELGEEPSTFLQQ